MTTKPQLITAFDNQGNAMSGCCDAAANPVAGPCAGLSGRRMQIASRIDDWNRLPAESHGFGPVVSALENSAAELAAAQVDGACLAAIDAAHAALEQLDALLDSV